MQAPKTPGPVSGTPKDNIHRKGFGLRREILPILAENYKSALVDEIKSQGYTYRSGRITFKLAKEFGFCYGVDKAIDFAYETRKRFPDQRIFITSEIIHNPMVNRKIMDMGIQFLSGPYKEDKGFDDLTEGDIVLLPAFGTTTEELELLKSKGCMLVDTTCGSVVAVWKRVEKYTEEGFTAVVHGKYHHEETKATCSRADKHIIVFDKKEAQLVCDYIVNGGDKEKFLARFEKAVSRNFDPDTDLVKVGCANQTTMLSSESLEIANMIQKAMAARYGETRVAEHFRHFDTICSATQERQDAIFELLGKEKIDLMIVIGGYNSSNTSHLSEISSAFGIRNFHVKDSDCFISKDQIEHKPVESPDPVVAEAWLPEGEITIGVSAGASTPNRVIEEVIGRISSLANQNA